ncbi:MAG: hypothetical protein LE179_00610 [Endomicrobium sp.]|nr:hypothetical protein [Endomicrobium sp.]
MRGMLLDGHITAGYKLYIQSVFNGCHFESNLESLISMMVNIYDIKTSIIMCYSKNVFLFLR